MILGVAVWLSPELIIGDGGIWERLIDSRWTLLALGGGASFFLGLVNFVPIQTWDGGKIAAILTEDTTPTKTVKIGLKFLVFSLLLLVIRQLLEFVAGSL